MDTANEHSELLALCKLLQESLQLPLYYLAAEARQSEAFGSQQQEQTVNPLFSTTLEQLHSLLEQEMDIALPTLLASPFLEQFMVVPVKEAAGGRSAVVIGPCSSEKPSAEIISNLMNDHRIPHSRRVQWSSYLQQLPHAHTTRMLYAGVLAYRLMNGVQLDITDVLQSYLQYSVKQPLQENVEVIVANQRESAMYHMELEAEKRFFELIANGKKDELMKGMIDLPYEEVGVLSKRSQLRNRKNFAIISIAFATRAAMSGGLYEELAFTLSDLHIQHIEELSDVKAVESATIAALLDFTERVGTIKKQGISKPVRLCQEYIYNQLYEPLAPAKLAELVQLNIAYLSQLFKKETGLPLASYIQREKIEEAKRLLRHTNDKIAAISTKLNFYDETYFVKVFKKHTGMTPRAYRTSSKHPIMRS